MNRFGSTTLRANKMIQCAGNCYGLVHRTQVLKGVSPPVEFLIEDGISLLCSFHVLVNWNHPSNFFSIMCVRLSRNSLADQDSLTPDLDFICWIRTWISFCLLRPPWRTACLHWKPQTTVITSSSYVSLFSDQFQKCLPVPETQRDPTWCKVFKKAKDKKNIYVRYLRNSSWCFSFLSAAVETLIQARISK